MYSGIKEINIKGKRYYLINGKKFPSVTTIISLLDKPAILHWAIRKTIEYLKKFEGKKITSEILELAENRYKYLKNAAAEKGTDIHKVVEYYLRTGYIPASFPTALGNFIDWKDKVDYYHLESEKLVINYKYQYAGRIDLLGKIKNIPYIIDLKTSKNIWISHKLQISAYKYALKKPVGMCILKLNLENRGHKAYYLKKEEYLKYIKIFLYLSRVFHLLEEKWI